MREILTTSKCMIPSFLPFFDLGSIVMHIISKIELREPAFNLSTFITSTSNVNLCLHSMKKVVLCNICYELFILFFRSQSVLY